MLVRIICGFTIGVLMSWRPIMPTLVATTDCNRHLSFDFLKRHMANLNEIWKNETAYYRQKRRAVDKMSEPGNSFSSEKIIVIIFGSVICLVLLLAIVREMYQSCRFPSSQILMKENEDVYAVIGDIQERIA
nr:uncharacterized protein LOC117682843 [Crassostrea gigas]